MDGSSPPMSRRVRELSAAVDGRAAEGAEGGNKAGVCTPTLRYGLVFIIHLIIIIVVFTVPTAPGVRQTIPPTINPTANPTTRSPTTA